MAFSAQFYGLFRGAEVIVFKFLLFFWELALVLIFFVASWYVYFPSSSSYNSSNLDSSSWLFFAPVAMYFVFINIHHAASVTLAGFERKELKSLLVFPCALLGVTEPDLPTWEWIWGVPLRSLLYTAFIYLSMAFFQNFVFNHASDLWSTTVLDYAHENEIFNEIDCTLLDIVDDVGYWFFHLTNTDNVLGIAMTDLLLYLSVYYNTLKYRSDFRLFDATVRPVLFDICHGVTINVSVSSSVLTQTALVALASLTLLLPWALLNGARRVFDSIFFWIIVLISVSAVFLSIFYLQDGVQILLAIIVSAPYTKTYTKTGIEGLIYLGAMGVIALVLCIPPLHQHVKVYGEMDRLRKGRQEQRKYGFLFSLTTSFVPYITKAITSPAFLLSLVTVCVCFATSQYPWPLTHASISVIPNATAPYPSYMNPNAFEEAALQATSIEQLFEYEVTNFTQVNAQMFEDVIGLIPDMKICISPLFVFTIADALDSSFGCPLGHEYNQGVEDFVKAIATNVIQEIAGWIEQVERISIQTIFTAIQDIVGLVSNVLSDFETYLNQLLSILKQELKFIYDIFVVLENIAEILEKIIIFWWTWFPLITAILVVFFGMLLLPIFKRIVDLVFLSFVIVVGDAILGAAMALFTLQTLLNEAGYQLNLTWNPQLCVLDILTVNILVITVLMFMTQDLYDDENYTSFLASQQILQSLPTPCRLHHKKPKSSKYPHNETEMEHLVPPMAKREDTKRKSSRFFHL